MALPGGYPNMLGPDDSEQIPFAYGSTVERLMVAKKQCDRDDRQISFDGVGRCVAERDATALHVFRSVRKLQFPLNRLKARLVAQRV